MLDLISSKTNEETDTEGHVLLLYASQLPLILRSQQVVPFQTIQTTDVHVQSEVSLRNEEWQAWDEGLAGWRYEVGRLEIKD